MTAPLVRDRRCRSGVVGPERRLSERLRLRLARQGSVDSVTDPVGWLIGRGLRQRGDCGDLRCDDAVPLDTGADCPRCENNLAGKRAARRRPFAEATAGVRGLDRDEVRVLAGSQLHPSSFSPSLRAGSRQERACSPQAWGTEYPS